MLYKQKILLIGDSCVDYFVEGKVARISPEAPVPVFSYSHESIYLGCAANVAISLSRLGLDVDLISFVSNDKNGDFLINKLKKEGVNTNYLISAKTNQKLFTSEKKRIVSNSHHICRIDREPNPIYIKEEINKFFEKNIKEALSKNTYTYTVISDYAKGIINVDSYKLINKLVKNKIILDPKPKNKILYENLFILKPNKKELIELMNLNYNFEYDKLENFENNIRDFILKNNIINLIVTDGMNGSFLITKDKFRHFPSKKVEVFDVSGAGDSFLAALIYYCTKGLGLSECISYANQAASTTVTHSGTTPLIPNDFSEFSQN